MHMVKAAAPRVIFEDDDLLIVDKPAPLVCHSASRPAHATLVGWVREHLAAEGGCDPATITPRLVNRLDRETSGIVIVAKNERAAKILGKKVLRREIEKQYLAICWGEFARDRGVIDKPIGFAKNTTVYTKRGVDEEQGRQCVTEFAVEKRLRGFTLARLWPRTGRAHQLRVHLAWMGHAIVGDKVYGPDENLYLQFIEKGVTGEMLEKLLMPRHALHAESVAFHRPHTQQLLTFHSALPKDMQDFLKGCG